MAEEQEYIIITVGDDNDVLLVENPETECTENAVSTDGVLPIQPNFQGGNDNSQLPFQTSNGVEGLAGLGDQPVSQMNRPANLRRCYPDSAEVEFIPLHKKGRSSVSMQDNMARNASEVFDKEKHGNQLVELQHCCEGLQDLIENTNKQVTQLCGIISKMQNTKEKSSLNRASPVVPTAGEPSLANTPEKMGNHSMGPDTASSSVHIPPNFVEMQEMAENSKENNPEAMNCPTVLINDSDQRSSSSFIRLPPEGEHYILIEVPENEETKLEIYPGSSGNESDLGTPSSILTIQPPFEVDKAQTNQKENIQMTNNPHVLRNNNGGQDIPRVLILSDVEVDKAQTNQKENTPMMKNPQVSENNNGDRDIPHVLIIPDIEVNNAQTKHKESSQMMNNPPLLGNKKGGQDMPHVIILSNAGDKAKTNQKENTQTMNNPHVLRNNNCGQNIQRVLILCDDEVDRAQNNRGKSIQMMNNPHTLGNNSGGQNIPHVFFLCDDEVDKTQSNLKENAQTMNNPHILGNNNGGQDNPGVLILCDDEVNKTQSNGKQNTQMMNSSHADQDNPRALILCDDEVDKTQSNQKENAQTMNNPHILGNNNGGQDNPHVLILCDGEVDKTHSNQKENTPTMNNPHVLGKNNGGQDNPGVLILCDDEMDKAQTNREENSQMMNNPQVLGSNNKAQTNREENSQMMNNPQVLGSNNGGQDTPTILIRSNDSSTEMRSETMIYPISLENGSKQGVTGSGPFFITPGYALLPLDIFVKVDNSMENSNGTMMPPIVLESDYGHESSSSPDSIPLHMGYLGDPKRNVTIHKMHLMNAQRKPEPKHAARYLIRNLFSKEVLMSSTVRVNSYVPNPSGRQLLDPNTVAALREYLTTAFPSHDLGERGRDWRACISYINSLIRYLCYTARKAAQKTVVTTQCNTPASADLNDKRDDDGGEGSSQLSKPAVASETRASGNSQPNSSAVPEEFEEPSTDDSVVPYRALNYIGNPSRNVQVSYSVLNIAKKKACPQMSASYLISQLFPEEVLLNSSVYGSLWRGICALNSNRINALREFLQEVYPTCDLSEGGRDWKLCVTSMNGYIHTLRHGCRNFTCESPPSPAMTSSIKSESSDTDFSD